MSVPDGGRAEGRKFLTPKNILEPDPTSTMLVPLDPRAGVGKSLDAIDWARSFLAPSLNDEVPREVRELFAAAQGLMVYGFFFYPLYALAEDQLFRVVDAAVTHRFLRAGGVLRVVRRHSVAEGREVEWRESPPFRTRMRFLVSQGIVSQQEEPWWLVMWELRSLSSHPTISRLSPQTSTLRTLLVVGEKIDALFSGEDA